MSSKCPKCGQSVSDAAVYCEHCGHWLKPYARSSYMQTAGTLMTGGAVGFLIIFILSVNALLGIYEWYPQFVAQQWFMYDLLVTTFSFLGLVSGALAAGLILFRRGSNFTVALALLCTISGASAFTISLIQPLAVLWESVLFFFLPLFIPPFVGTLIAYWRKEELKSPTK